MRRLELCSIVAILLLAGCSQSKPEPDGNAVQPAAAEPGSSSAACDILTRADAEKALGHSAEKLDSSGGLSGGELCQYGYQGERIAESGNASLTLHKVDLGSLRQGVVGQGYSVEPVAGLGDEAFWSKDAGLYVGKGNRTAIYMVGVFGDEDDARKRRAIDLAKATVSRL